MKQALLRDTLKNSAPLFAAIAGINLIIFIHELGHFLCARFFQLTIATFSLGFGPALYQKMINGTVFQIALIPLGGYVELDPHQLSQQSYIAQMIILLGGIIFNILFAYIIFAAYSFFEKRRLKQNENIESYRDSLKKFIKQEALDQSIIGPIGILAIISKIVSSYPHLYGLVLALLSINIALINLLPVPFFDGGKVLLITIEKITGYTINPTLTWILSILFLALIIFILIRATTHDISLFKQRNQS